MKSSAQSRELTAQVEIPSGIPNGEKGMAGLCWLIASIQVIFGLGDFMQSIYQAWRETKQSNEPVDDLLSTTLIDIWLALGYKGGKVATKKEKLLLLRTFRDKLIRWYQTWYNEMMLNFRTKNFEKLTNKQKDRIQFDAGEAYIQIIDLLEKELGMHECINLVSWVRTPDKPNPERRENSVQMSSYNYRPGQTIYDFLDETVARVGRFGGEPSKYLVFSWGAHDEKRTRFDFVQPQKLSMDEYFPDSANTNYQLIGLLSHCGEDILSGHNLAYRLINDKWYYFNDIDVCEIGEDMIGKAYGFEVEDFETAYVAFYEQV